MIKQYIELGNKGWNIVIYYGVDHYTGDMVEELLELGCSGRDILESLNLVTKRLNNAVTFSVLEHKTSMVYIGHTTSVSQFVNSVVHEAKHVQSHICQYYNIDEDGETAAYLIGHIVQRMYKILAYYYGRF